MPDEAFAPQPFDLQPPTLKEAFGFEFDGSIPPSIQLGLSNAADTVGNAQQKIRQSLTSQWVDHAVTTDMMAGKIGQTLGTQLLEATGATQQLQAPINTQLVGQLGNAYEAAIPLGANLNTPDVAALPPACVQIRTAGATGDLGPAIDCYRALAYNQRFTRGSDYQSVVQFIADSLPALPNIQQNWAQTLLSMQNEPDTPSVPATAFPAGYAVPSDAHSSGPPVAFTSISGGTPAPWVGPITGPNPGFAPNPPPGMIPGSGAPPVSPPFVPISPPSGGVPVPGGQPSGPGFIPGSGPPPVGGGPIPVPTPITCDAQGNCHFVGGQAGSGPPPGYVPPSEPGPSTPPSTMPPAPPSTKRPETPSTPPPPTTQPCIRLCPTDPPKCEYQLVCSSDHILYVIKATDKPRSSFDKVVATGDPAGWDIDQIAQSCQIRQPSQPAPPPAQGGGAPVGPFAGGCADFPQTPIAGGINVGTEFLNWIGLVDNAGNPTVPFPNAGVTDIGEKVVNGLTGLAGTIIQSLTTALGQFLAQTGCADGNQLGLVTIDLLVGFLERWIGVDLSQLRLPNAYQRQFRCPVMLPSIADAASAWLANQIDDNTLQCWIQANNGRFKEFAAVVRANRSSLSALDYGALYQREKINQNEFNSRLRETGYIRDVDAQNVMDLLKQIPPPSDIVRMMVRDAADENLVQQFGLDDSFGDKFQGKVEEWTRQQGIDPLYMRFLWRSHWSIPSPGQLAEMLHRLSRRDPGDPAYVDLQTIKTALQQQDIAPFWIDKFVATSYRPLTRIDARRAYETGALDDASLVDAYQNLGYNDSDANTLLRFNKVQAMLKFARHPAVKQYAKGELNGGELDDTLKAYGATDEAIQFARLQATRTMNALRRSRCLTSLRRRFLLGDLDQNSTIESIRSLGLEQEQAEMIQAGWQCERDAQGKSIPTGALCTLYEQGAITIPDMTERLQRLGYSYDDSVLLARKCARRVQDKLTKLEQQRLREQERQQQKYLNDSLRQTARDEAARKAQQRNAERMRRVALAQTKRMQEAGLHISKNFGISLPDGVAVAELILQNFLGQTLYTKDEIIQALLVESGSPQATSTDVLTTAVAAALPV